MAEPTCPLMFPSRRAPEALVTPGDCWNEPTVDVDGTPVLLAIWQWFWEFRQSGHTVALVDDHAVIVPSPRDLPVRYLFNASNDDILVCMDANRQDVATLLKAFP